MRNTTFMQLSNGENNAAKWVYVEEFQSNEIQSFKIDV